MMENTSTNLESKRDQLLDILAARKGYGYSKLKGLIDKNSGETVAEDLNTVAKILLGQMMTEKNISTIENTVTSMTKLYDYDRLAEKARSVLEGTGIEMPSINSFESSQIGTVDWFKRMIEVCQ